MDCLRTFSITINQNTLFTAPEVRTWGNVGNYHWAMESTNTSFYDVQGFKNINLFSIEMVGQLQSDAVNYASDFSTVLDYGFILDITGQMPEVSGKIGLTPNVWNILTPYNDELCLSKFNPKLTFNEPIQSFKRVSFEKLFANGQNATTINTVALNYNLTFIFNYKYEGE